MREHCDDFKETSVIGTAIYCCSEKGFMGDIVFADIIKQDSKDALKNLRKLGIKETIMMTGDKEVIAKDIAKKADIDTVYSRLMPDEKANIVSELQKSGKTVVYTGDGINDAPALTRADVGIAIGAGTDIAIESADIVLMKSDLQDVVTSIELSHSVIKNIKENLFWAFFYNALGIPVAAGVLYGIAGLKLNPMIAALAMSFSSVFVVSNALRLRFFKPKCNNIKTVKNEKENKTMTKTIKINGMMCSHCTGRVGEVLNAIDGVSAEVSLDNGGQAVVTLAKDVSDDVLKKAVVDAGYEVVGIE